MPVDRESFYDALMILGRGSLAQQIADRKRATSKLLLGLSVQQLAGKECANACISGRELLKEEAGLKARPIPALFGVISGCLPERLPYRLLRVKGLSRHILLRQ